MNLLISQNAGTSAGVVLPVWAVILAVCVALAAVLGLRALLAVERAKLQARAAQAKREDDLAEIAAGLARVQPVEHEPAAEVICLNCKHFELEAAQRALAQNKAFAQMTQLIQPWQYGRRPVYKDDPCTACDPALNEGCAVCGGQRVVTTLVDYVYPDNNPPVQATWADHGWCTSPRVVYEGNADFTSRLMWGGRSNCEGKLYELRPKAKPQLRAV